MKAPGSLPGEPRCPGSAPGWVEPEPLRETPGADHFCDLVLTGGVASGVVYPWAIVELARHFRFRNIGGSSVGAMAAALAAASEYGRRNNVPYPFEVLRRVPGALAEERAGRTKMLRLFQPSAAGQRLFDLFVLAVKRMGNVPKPDPKPGGAGTPAQQQAAATAAPAAHKPADTEALGQPAEYAGLAGAFIRAYGPDALKSTALPLLLLVLMGTLLVASPLLPLAPAWRVPAWLIGVALGALLLLSLLWGLARALLKDIRHGVFDNDLGLCKGKSQSPPGTPEPEQGLCDWLHEGIQKAAGLEVGAAPLTFGDLWAAPLLPGHTPGAAPALRSINLEVFTTNVTLGRPVRLPASDDSTRLYFKLAEWDGIFPAGVMAALRRDAQPYRNTSPSDPDVAEPDLLELPMARLPVVVAARMSLSFPVLFSAIPVWVVHYETPRNPDAAAERQNTRPFRKCWLSDGGICSNFPIHLFDVAIPRWPTFGLLLDRRLAPNDNQAVWLPQEHREGRHDNLQAFVPGAAPAWPGRFQGLTGLAGFLLGVVATAKDWNDRVTLRLPQARNRVVRLALREGEGQLNIAMPGAVIMRMAHEYGSAAAQKLVQAYVPSAPGAVSAAWYEHVYVRTQLQVAGLRQLLKGFSAACANRAHSLPVPEMLQAAQTGLGSDGQRAPYRPANLGLALREPHNRQGEDPTALRPSPENKLALERALAAMAELECALADPQLQGAYRPEPPVDLRLRAPF